MRWAVITKLLDSDYFCLFLFSLLNPVVDSMRGLCAASHLKRVQEDVCTRPVSLGSFSEARGVFEPELLKRVFLPLACEMPISWGDARLTDLADKLKIVAGTLLPPCHGCTGRSGLTTKTALPSRI